MEDKTIHKSLLEGDIEDGDFSLTKWDNNELKIILEDNGIKVTNKNIIKFKKYLLSMNKGYIKDYIVNVMNDIADILKDDGYFE